MGDKIKFIYTDTDSFVIEVETDDIYKDMYEDRHLYGFSDYPKDHPNYNLNNKKIYGIYKDDLNAKIIIEFTADKPKMCSYEYIDNYLDMLKNCEHDEYELIKSKMRSNEYIDNYTILNKNKHKGIKISVDLKHNEYKRALLKNN